MGKKIARVFKKTLKEYDYSFRRMNLPHSVLKRLYAVVFKTSNLLRLLLRTEYVLWHDARFGLIRKHYRTGKLQNRIIVL